MKICITSKEASLESELDPKFGRCAYFIFVETNKLGFEAFSNTNADESQGAGIQSVQFISEHGPDVILTGNIGPNVYDTLSAAGIKIITGVSGIVKDAINKYENGELKSVDNFTINSHFEIKLQH